MVRPGFNGVPHGLVTNDFNTYQPRLGFADDLFGNGKTVLRGGFGTFFERLQGKRHLRRFEQQPALIASHTERPGSVYFSQPTCSWESTASTAIPANCGSPTSLPIYPANLTAIATTYKAPGAAMYSLGLQHEVRPSMIAVVQYVGNLGWHQNVVVPVQQLPAHNAGCHPS